jgi:hypothetical protein
MNGPTFGWLASVFIAVVSAARPSVFAGTVAPRKLAASAECWFAFSTIGRRTNSGDVSPWRGRSFLQPVNTRARFVTVSCE